MERESLTGAGVTVAQLWGPEKERFDSSIPTIKRGVLSRLSSTQQVQFLPAISKLESVERMKYPDLRIVYAGGWNNGKGDGPKKWVVLDAHGSRPVVCESLEEAILVIRKWTEIWV